MLKYNLKIAWRYLLKDRAFTCLNLVGLCTGLTCTILIYLWIADEWHVNKYNKLEDRLFQVLKNSQSPAGISTDEHMPGLLAMTLKKELPEVEYAASVIPVSWSDKKGILISGDRRIFARPQFAGDDYFRMFSYPLIAGRADDVLRDKNSVVISDELARRLFPGADDVTGKAVIWNQEGYSGIYRISGIFERPLQTADARFDIVFNYSLFLDKTPKLTSWDNYDPSTYVVLKQGTSMDQFNRKIAGLIKSRVENSSITLWAQKYSDRYLHGHYENGVPSGGRIEYVRLFSLIALFILVIACINFMNLSTAKAAERIKEAGVKKVVGASRFSLIIQFMAESSLLTLFSLVAALGLVALLLPEFNQITGKQLSLHFSAELLWALFGIALVTGFLSGSYPAWYLSNFKPAVMLQPKIKTSISGLIIRKGLVVFQFTLSAIFILSVLVIYRQMRLIETRDLGYNRENVLYFEAGDMLSADSGIVRNYESAMQGFLNEIRSVPGVVDAANFRHNITNRDGGTYDISWPGKDPNARIDFTDLDVGYNFIETAGIRLKEGRTYSRSFGNEKANIIFNETAIRTMGLKDPVGKVVTVWGNPRTIIGVVKDFNFQSLHQNIKPCFLDLYVNRWASKVLVRVRAQQQSGTIATLEELYKRYNQGEPFEFRFLDQDYQQLYAAETRVSALSKYFAAIAVIVSCLGLLGVAAFAARKRQREISIRKVVGASVNSIVLLLTRDFLILIGIALLIAFPLSWLAMTQWLHGFAYHVHLGPGVFLIAAVFIVLMAVLSISFQSVKAAMASPIENLRGD